MDLLGDLKKSFLNFSFVMIYIIHEMLVLLENIIDFYVLLFFFLIIFHKI